MKSLIVMLTTSKGWIVRQAVKATAYVTTPLTVWLSAQGADADHTSAVVTGIIAAASIAVELGLSFIARKNP